jgi:hypothetical protein
MGLRVPLALWLALVGAYLAMEKPPAATGYAIVIIALITVFTAWIAFRTVVLAVRGPRLRLGWLRALLPN